MTDATYVKTRYETAARELVALHILPDLFPLGGTPRKLASVVGDLSERGIHMVFLIFNNADEGMVDQITTAGGCVLRAPRRVASDPRMILDVARACVHSRADVVVTHFPRADIYGVLGARLVGRPVIKQVEGVFWSDRGGLIVCDRMLGWLRCLVVANSKATLQAARRRGGVGRAVVLYPGVRDTGPRALELGWKVREELFITKRAVVVGHIGGFIALRLQATLIEAIAIAAQEVPLLQLVLIGDGPLRSHLRHTIYRLGVNENVTMLGYRGDVDRIRHAFDIYVNPAEAEGFGLATVEAMLTGIPVVVADSGGSPELVDDGQTGVVVPAGDSAALARAIVALAQCPDRASAMGLAARQAALQRFSMRLYADDLERAYKFAAGSRRRRGGYLMRLAIVTNILAPYRVPLLNSVAATEDMHLRVFLAAEREPERHWSWFDDIRFEYEIRRGLSWRGRQGFVRHVNPGMVHAVRSWKPDVVIAGGTLTISLLGLAAARLARCPFVWWVDATAESDAAMSYAWLMGAKRRLARASSAFVASSAFSASYLVELGADASRVHKSLLGIDPAPFAAAVSARAVSRADIAAELHLKGPVVLYVGQLERYKGVDLLLDACELVGAEERISLLLVGRGSLEESLRERAARSLCNVVFAGFLQPEDLPRIYAVADVFCLLSRYEPFGVVVSEAVAAGLPVICSSHAGASGDLVCDGENGFVVSPENSAQVADRIRAVILDPAMSDAMRLASTETAKKLAPLLAVRGIVDAAEQANASRGGQRR